MHNAAERIPPVMCSGSSRAKEWNLCAVFSVRANGPSVLTCSSGLQKA